MKNNIGFGFLKRVHVFHVLCLVCVNVFGCLSATLEETLSDDSDLSQFYSYLENSSEAKSFLAFRQLTLFVPTNEAFQNVNFNNSDDKSDLVNYHMLNQALHLNQLPSKVSTELPSNPPLWITRRSLPAGREDIYVNNARIAVEKSNVEFLNSKKRKQVLHIIEDVLEPVKSVTNEKYNPDAYELLAHSTMYNIQPHTLTKFKKCVEDYNKGVAFKADSRFTFFIPVDEGFNNPVNRAGAIDEKIIDGHIIPNHVLFTKPTPFDVQYETLAVGDMVKVYISFKKELDGTNSGSIYIVSNTVVGDQKHKTGVVLAKIVKANIPVSNGVVHLISRPLMVVDTPVKQFLEVSGGILSSFYDQVLQNAPEFLSHITDSETITLFAPSNAAMKTINWDAEFSNKTKAKEIFNLHLIKGQRITMEEIAEKKIKEADSMNPAKKLYFNVHNHVFTVDGGGVNATVTQPNIASTNGIIHIIDSVLGLSRTTVRRKLETDSELQTAYHLGEPLGFNDQFDNTRLHFTYFVPRNSAWKSLEVKYPSLYKKVHMSEFAPNVKQILERHVVIADKAYTMSELKKYANVSYPLPSVRDHLQIQVHETEGGKGFNIDWRNQKIHVYRPDVECTNGIIHIIDSVFLTESDIQVNSAPVSSARTIATAAACLLLTLIPNFLH